MRRLSFIIAIIGIFALLLILFNSPPLPLSSLNQTLLSSFPSNQKFQVEGTVLKESIKYNYKLLQLDNSLTIECDLSCPSFLNKNISSTVILERYNSRDYLKILKIKSLPIPSPLDSPFEILT